MYTNKGSQLARDRVGVDRLLSIGGEGAVEARGERGVVFIRDQIDYVAHKLHAGLLSGDMAWKRRGSWGWLALWLRGRRVQPSPDTEREQCERGDEGGVMDGFGHTLCTILLRIPTVP